MAVAQNSGRQGELEVVAERRGGTGPVEQQFADRQTVADGVCLCQGGDR
jgi:hypothetical protein